MTAPTSAALAVATTPAERLAAIMLKGESQRAFADRVGIDQAAVSKLLSGKKADLDLDTWRTIAAATGLPLGLLIGADEPPRPTGPGLRDIPWILIEPSPLNPRKVFDEETIVELAASIEKAGVLQNLVVRPKSGDLDDPQGYWLISGERRYRAVRHLIETGRAGMQDPMPCRVVVADDREHLRMAVVENLQRQDVAPLEEAEAFNALRGAGWGTDEIATECGKTRRFVQLRLSLVDKLTPEGQKALRDGKISAEVARTLATAEPKKQKDILKSGSFRTADDVRQRLRGYDGVHVSKIRFDLALYTGPRYEDDTGSVWLQDKKRVSALQFAWAEGEAKRLVDAGEVAWAHATDGYISEHDIEHTEDPALAGVLLRVTYDAAVEIVTGVDRRWWDRRLKRDTDERDARAQINAEWEARRASQEARQKFKDAVCAELRLAVLDADDATRMRLGLALCLYGLHADYNDPLKVRGVTDNGPMRQLVGTTLVGDDRQIVAGSEELVMRALLRADVYRLADTVAHCVAGWLRYAANHQGFPPHVKPLAETLGVEIPTELLAANAVRQDDEDDAGDDDQLDIEDAIDAAEAA